MSTDQIIEQSSPGAGYCHVSENGDLLEITWTDDNMIGVATFDPAHTQETVAVERWKGLQ
jgi:hypothetical protein